MRISRYTCLMPAVHADLSIAARWIVPMTSRGEVLEHHTVVVRDGRILEVLPHAEASQRYAPGVALDRPHHLLMPGLVNARTALASEPTHAGAVRRIAQMLRSGTTCFCTAGLFPTESLRAAVEQGMRALVGMPIADAPSAWARNSDEYLTRALALRDEFSGHPTIATAFAPYDPAAIDDALFGRIATLSNELDAPILVSLHESAAEIARSLDKHGLRPLERLHSLGLLTPALTAVHMAAVSASDTALAQRSGIGVILCPESSLRLGHGPPPIAEWVATGVRLGLGSSAQWSAAGLDLWSQLRLLTLLSATPAPGGTPLTAWDSLAIATLGGAAALGLDAEIGSLAAGKWADLCCVDMTAPWLQITQGNDAVERLAFDGSRDAVSDVWVAGRQLLADGSFTRLEWPALAARTGETP